MGSSFSLVLFGPDRPGLESAAAAAFAEAHRLDRLLSNYLAGSEWSAMNREAAEPASPRDARAVCAALRLPGIQPHERWGVRHHRRTSEKVGASTRGRWPAEAEELKEMLNRVGNSTFKRDPGPRTVRFGRARHGNLDPQGLARLCGRPDGRRNRTGGLSDRARRRIGQQHLRPGRAAR